jgi:hypothetical protein
MDYFDPWIVRQLAEAHYQSEIRQVIKARLARRASTSTVDPSTQAGVQRPWSRLVHILTHVTVDWKFLVSHGATRGPGA